MKSKNLLTCFGVLALCLTTLLLMTARQATAATQTVMFGPSNEFWTTGLTTSQITAVQGSGFTTIVLFSMNVDSSGDFHYGGQTICTAGSYVGPSNWGTLLSQCKTSPTSVSRIEMCVGGYGDTSFQNIKTLIALQGTSSGTNLYKNLTALKNALGITAIDYDDEGTYDSPSAVSFGQMCNAVGMKVTLCPYTNSSYWAAVKAGLGSGVDYIYLQCYDGGAGNDPASWATSLGVPIAQIVPGYWDFERDTTFLNYMVTWHQEGCGGGFLWPSCTGCNPPAGSSELAQYAHWILDTYDPVGNNCSFETPSIGAGNYRYSPTGATWTFTGASPSGSGIVANSSPFGNPNALEGTQAAFVQEVGTISQAFSGFTPGAHYTMIFNTAQRPGGNQHGGESWNVTLDGSVIASYNPGASATSYSGYAAAFTATASTHTLAFVGTDLATGDNTVFIDGVRITKDPISVPPAPTGLTATIGFQ